MPSSLEWPLELQGLHPVCTWLKCTPESSKRNTYHAQCTAVPSCNHGAHERELAFDFGLSRWMIQSLSAVRLQNPSECIRWRLGHCCACTGNLAMWTGTWDRQQWLTTDRLCRVGSMESLLRTPAHAQSKLQETPGHNLEHHGILLPLPGGET